MQIEYIHKKKDKTKTENFRPINLLPTVSKVFEKICVMKLTHIRISTFHPSFLVLERVTALKNVLLLCLKNRGNNLIRVYMKETRELKLVPFIAHGK